MNKSIILAVLLGAISAAAAAGTAAPDTPAQAGSAASAADASGLGPREIVQNSAQRMLVELDANRAMYKKDPAKLDSLVANVLLPKFDSEYAARLVLGLAWRSASEEQRKRFVDAFYHSLLRNYGAALVDFTADRFKILPFRGEPGDTQATVHTEVKRASGESVPVDFTLHKTDTGWKAWDVVIESISYVKSFRTDIGAEVQAKGLDEVITRLEREEQKPATGGGAGR
jgi:phospholipid transport system substrate-binding protein